MRLESILFNGNKLYQDMARVLKLSASINSPETLLTLHHITDPDEDVIALAGPRTRKTYVDNTRKTKHHCRLVQEAQNGELLCLMDSDTMILNSMVDIRQMEFDLAYTIRPAGSRWPFNTGVVFVRISDKTKEWYRLWYENTRTLLQNTKLMAECHKKYGRINQSGLGLLFESHPDMLKLLELPCAIWNCIPETYSQFKANETKVVHLMGPLRHGIVGQSKGRTKPVARLLEIWKLYAKAIEEDV